MSADALHVRRTRQAVYGPPISAVVGLVLAAIGVIGLAVRDETSTAAPPAAVEPALVPPIASTFVLVDAEANIYRDGDLGTPVPVRDAKNLDAIVGAARAATGGLWLVDANGSVAGRRAPVLGEVEDLPEDSAIVGIAPTTDGSGYRLVSSEGRVFAFGTRGRGEVKARTAADAVVGIASSAGDGYWIAQRNGKVSAFLAPKYGAVRIPKGDHVVGIASEPTGRGYWLVTAAGRVIGAGVPEAGDLISAKVRGRATGIAGAVSGGYWITTDSGRVYSFGGAPGAVSSPRAPLARVIAVVPG
jgi:hypothetical protein